MQKVYLHLWFEQEAAEALGFYASLFEDSGIDNHLVLPDTPGGDTAVYNFHLAGIKFQAINGGPFFKFNQSISLGVMCATAQEVDRLHAALTQGGKEHMPLDAYPFCARYAWVEDRYGLHWQLMLTDSPITQKIVPNLLFSGPVNGKAEEAMRHYAGLLPDSSVDFVNYYGDGEVQAPSARVNYGVFTLAGMHFTAMDNAMAEEALFNEALSIVIDCKDQEEIDRLWETLSASPENEQCGWLKDRFGLSWQIVPADWEQISTGPDGRLLDGVVQAMLQMKKLDIAALRAAGNKQAVDS